MTLLSSIATLIADDSSLLASDLTMYRRTRDQACFSNIGCTIITDDEDFGDSLTSHVNDKVAGAASSLSS
jgi:hypothetical protein